MYQVHQHRYGIKVTITTTGNCWEHDFAGHEWEVIWQGRKKADAFASADACPMHAVVTKAHMSESLHDNGKTPGNRVTDQRPDPSIPLRSPRDPAAYGLPEIAATHRAYRYAGQDEPGDREVIYAGTLEQCRGAIASRIGKLDGKRWSGADGDVEAYHESDHAGCGGYAVRPV